MEENFLSSKTALVTGGAQGLGRAITLTLAAAGARVIVADIKEQEAQAVVEEARVFSPDSRSILLDVRNEENIKEVTGIVDREFRKLDILVNNAAIDVTKPFEEIGTDQWNKELETNLRGPILLCHYLYPLMQSQKSGHIINILSTAAKRAWPNASAYHTTKWGLLGFSNALYTEARAFNIKVTAMVAGGMKTPFILDRFPDTDVSKLQDPQNVAETIKFILSQPTGTIIPEVLVLPLMETSWP